MKAMKKYVFHYDAPPLYWLNARSIKGVIRQLKAMGMERPVCIEDCHGSEIWWNEDGEQEPENRHIRNKSEKTSVFLIKSCNVRGSGRKQKVNNKRTES
ncbi:MAG: hypothetical protein WCI95_13475 [bacterium]